MKKYFLPQTSNKEEIQILLNFINQPKVIRDSTKWKSSDFQNFSALIVNGEYNEGWSKKMAKTNEMNIPILTFEEFSKVILKKETVLDYEIY